MEFDEKHLTYVYQQVRWLKRLNCIFKNRDDEKYVRLEEHKVPKRIREGESEALAYYNKLFLEDRVKAVYAYEDSYGLRYIGMGMQIDGEYKGHIILGPYMTVRIEEERIREILNKKQIRISEKRELIAYYKALPILNVLEEMVIGKMAYMSLQLGDMGIRHIPPHGKIEDERSGQGKLEKRIQEGVEANKEIFAIPITGVAVNRSNQSQKEVIYYINQGDWQRAIRALSGLNEHFIESVSSNQLKNFKNLILTLNGMIKYSLVNRDIDHVKMAVVVRSICIELEECKGLGDLQRLIKEMIKEYCKLVNEMKDQGYSPLILGATQYIRFNFEQEVTLKKLAEYLYVHPNYLSRKFKEETGCQLSEYINHIRIEQAQMLLKDKLLSITDIAYRVGYNDEKYFSKVFKKYSYKTPREYRNS
ncbi:MAG: helix-turn-helix transcriptional regulator [Cellulosilyticaceae bacterium]